MKTMRSMLQPEKNAVAKVAASGSYVDRHCEVGIPRAAPFKAITVPRLELVASVIGVRLSKFVGKALTC